MKRETMKVGVYHWASACSTAALVLALGAAWVSAASAAAPAFNPNDVAAPNSIIVDRFPQPIDSTDITYHAGQYAQYRVRAYGPDGHRAPCNGGAPQVLTHDPVHAVSQAWPSEMNGNSVVNVIMGASTGGAYLEVSCGSSVKKVILNNDGEPLPPDQQAANYQLIQAANPPTPVPPPPGVAQPPQFAASTPPPAADEQQPAPAPEESSGSGVGAALLITGAVVLTAVVVAVAASGLSKSSGSSCSNGSHQCSPPNSSVCCPDGTTIYCTNNGTCTNQTLSNFGDICGSGNNSTAAGC